MTRTMRKTAAITAAMGLALLTGCAEEEETVDAAPAVQEPVIEQPIVEEATVPPAPPEVTVTIRDQRGEPGASRCPPTEPSPC